MKKYSAGLLMFRRNKVGIEVLLVHPGGPFWAKKDLGAWSIPKGEFEDSEDPLDAAIREFREETGFPVSEPFTPLGTIKQPSGKLVTAWAFEGDCDPATLISNSFELEWPPRSGKMSSFPEIDRAAWFDPANAKERILKGQIKLIEELELKILGSISTVAMTDRVQKSDPPQGSLF